MGDVAITLALASVLQLPARPVLTEQTFVLFRSAHLVIVGLLVSDLQQNMRRIDWLRDFLGLARSCLGLDEPSLIELPGKVLNESERAQQPSPARILEVRH